MTATLDFDPQQLFASTTAFRSAVARLPLGERLVQAGLLTPEELQAALARQSARSSRLGEVLTEMGFVDEEDLLPYLAAQMGIESVRLRDGVIDPEAVKLLPRHHADRLEAVALMKVFDTLTVAMTEPQDLRRVDELERVTGLCVRPVLALRKGVVETLKRCYDGDFAVDAVTADIDRDSVAVAADSVSLDLKDLGSLADGSPIINLVNYIVVHAVRQGASDIHVEPGQGHTSIRYRVDGQLREVLRPKKEFHPALVSRIKVLAKLDIAEHRAPQDGRVHASVEGREIDLRVSTLPTVLGEKVVLRVLDRRNVTFDLDRLGVPLDRLTSLKRMLGSPHGLVLVTGPTGSGKTTTLYSALELIKGTHRNVVTVEDPVEYQLELINQVQAGISPGMTFANALRSILRQDPDVIMVGEIRDAETAEVAIQAALTGHLVLSTLHTNDSASAITRLMDMGIASYKIAAALAGVVAQRLVRTVCPGCRSHYYPSAEYLELLHYTGDRRRQFIRGEGCRDCHDTGFRGRRGIYEIFPCTPDVRSLISGDASLDRLRAAQTKSGMTTLRDEGLRLAEEGLTSLEEIAAVTLFD